MIEVKRSTKAFELWQGPFRMEARFTSPELAWAWNLQGFPQSLVNAAKKAICSSEKRIVTQLDAEGIEFPFYIRSLMLGGCFKSKSNPEWIDFEIKTPQGQFIIAMRLAEVKKLVLLLEEYWCD